MCPSLEFFHTYKELQAENNHITIPDGTKITVTHIGNIKLNNFIELTDVLYAPSFKFNLISVSKLCKTVAYCVHLTSELCTIHEHSVSQSIPLGRHSQGLYVSAASLFPQTAASSLKKVCLPSVMPCSVASSIVKSRLDEAKLLHLRLGHISYSKLSTISNNVDVNCIKDSICTICPVERQHRLSFFSSNTKTSKKIELLHIDVWGIYKTFTHHGCKYFLTIVDDYSRATWVHLMQSKTDSVSIIQNFLYFIQNQFHTTVKIIRTDNALELCQGNILI